MQGLIGGLNLESSHPMSNCKSCRLSTLVSELRMEEVKLNTYSTSLLAITYYLSQLWWRLNLLRSTYFEHTIQSHVF